MRICHFYSISGTLKILPLISMPLSNESSLLIAEPFCQINVVILNFMDGDQVKTKANDVLVIESEKKLKLNVCTCLLLKHFNKNT